MDLWFSEFHTPYVKFSIQIDKQLHSEQKKIDTLDFLICAMKTKENADVLNQLLTSRRNPSIPQSHQTSEHRSNIDF